MAIAAPTLGIVGLVISSRHVPHGYAALLRNDLRADRDVFNELEIVQAQQRDVSKGRFCSILMTYRKRRAMVSLGYEGSYNRVAAFPRAWRDDRQRELQTTGRGTSAKCVGELLGYIHACGQALPLNSMATRIPGAAHNRAGKCCRRLCTNDSGHSTIRHALTARWNRPCGAAAQWCCR